MTKIFEPILNSAIIYIDDILLFSRDKESHKVLLEQFISLADQHGGSLAISSRRESADFFFFSWGFINRFLPGGRGVSHGDIKERFSLFFLFIQERFICIEFRRSVSRESQSGIYATKLFNFKRNL